MAALKSREYKMMLQASRFNGDSSELRAQANALWSDLTAIIVPHAVAVTGTDDVEHRRRRVRFFDTPDQGSERATMCCASASIWTGNGASSH